MNADDQRRKNQRAPIDTILPEDVCCILDNLIPLDWKWSGADGGERNFRAEAGSVSSLIRMTPYPDFEAGEWRIAWEASVSDLTAEDGGGHPATGFGPIAKNTPYTYFATLSALRWCAHQMRPALRKHLNELARLYQGGCEALDEARERSVFDRRVALELARERWPQVEWYDAYSDGIVFSAFETLGGYIEYERGRGDELVARAAICDDSEEVQYRTWEDEARVDECTERSIAELTHTMIDKVRAVVVDRLRDAGEQFRARADELAAGE